MLTKETLHGTIKGIALIFAYIMVEPFQRDFQDTFGNAFLFHTFAKYVTLFSLVFVNTDSLEASIAVIFVYEIVKNVWKLVKPENSRDAKINKLFHRVQNKKELTESDVKFLNEITPENVKVTTATASG